MNKIVVRNKVRIIGLCVLAIVVGMIGAPGLNAGAADRTETSLAVERALQRLPYYGVFDFLAYGVDHHTVTLAGYAYLGNLRANANDVVKQIPGIAEVANKIEVLPASQEDDRIRWATFYRIYTDEFLSRYAPGRGAMSARYEALSFARFPGMQPYGMYPIHIIVKNRRTTLVGVVDNESDKTIAGIRAREVPHIFGVENELAVSGK